MGLFSKKKGAAPGGGRQYPDELAEEAQLAYGTSDFARAMEGFATAIDKLHTMYMVASPGSRIRSPGPQDQPILDGFVNSVGAGLSMDLPLDRTLTEKTLNYLGQIAVEAGSEADRYNKAVSDAQWELR